MHADIRQPHAIARGEARNAISKRKCERNNIAVDRAPPLTGTETPRGKDVRLRLITAKRLDAERDDCAR